MKKLRYVLEAQDGAPETPGLKLTTGSKRHRRNDLGPASHHPFSYAESGPARGHDS
jgi:hypothetical protein